MGMGCHVVKSRIVSQLNFELGSQPKNAIAANMDERTNNNNNRAEIMTDTQPQTQSQSTNTWSHAMDSQPVENIVWGRLYPKSVKIKSLDLCNPSFAAGRDESNELCLTRRELPEKILCRISKVHFHISKDTTDMSSPAYIQDMSRNGTFLNGEKIGHRKRQILLNDDVISLSHPQYKAFVYKDLSPNEAHGLPRDICTQYHIGRKLGSGACGVVRLVYNRRTCEVFAMKHIRKNQLMMSTRPEQQLPPKRRALVDDRSAEARRIDNEGAIMRSLQHPCVVKMYECIDDSDSVFIMLELMRGGDLLSRILSKKRLTEPLSKLYFFQLCHAVKYMHDKNITHRDLKPDNVLLQTDEDETLLKVSDFGLSKSIDDDSVMRTLCGTPLYVAPEVLQTGGRGSYTNKVDVWSLGVVLFTCLSGTLPFSDEYGTMACDQIKKGLFSFRSAAWRTVSAQAKSLISQMLTVRAEKRLSIDEVLASDWMSDDEVRRKAERLMQVKLDDPRLKTAASSKTGGSSVDVFAVEEVVATLTIDAKHNMPTMQNVENQENISVNFLHPPAAKRRRIEQI